MKMLLGILQVLAALLYGASGIMKVLLFDKISADVPSFGALPRGAWMALGVLELVCVGGLIVPIALRSHPQIALASAAALALESLIFVWVHLRYREFGPLALSAALGLLMTFIAYGQTFAQ